MRAATPGSLLFRCEFRAPGLGRLYVFLLEPHETLVAGDVGCVASISASSGASLAEISTRP